VQVAPAPAHHLAQLRGHGQPAGGGERLGDLVDGELPQRAGVDGRGVAAQREHQHRRYSRSGVISTNPFGRGTGSPASYIRRST
jgi:hypothetical protein